MQETWIRPLDQEDPLVKEMATTPVFLPGKSHEQRNLVGHSPWGHKRDGHDLTTKPPPPPSNPEGREVNLELLLCCVMGNGLQ